MDKYVLAVHGGAGTIKKGQADEQPYHEGLQAALRAGEQALIAGGDAVDAVVAAVASLEDCPRFNAGRGSVYTSAQTHEMDAGVMNGANLDAGAVAAVHGVRNPVVLAQAVMNQTPCVVLAGDGALALARELDIEQATANYFAEPSRLAQLKMAQELGREGLLDHTGAAGLATQDEKRDVGGPIDESTKFGTVGAVARDRNGNLAAAVSTGGLTNKRPGRVGDSPLPGAGFYANNQSCASVATGTGEHFIRAVAAYDIHARMAYKNQDLASAARDVLEGQFAQLGGTGGMICIDRDGQVSMPFISGGMYRGVVREGAEPETMIF